MKRKAESDEWEIDDAEVRHRNAPDRHFLLPLDLRTEVLVGEQVELLFLFRGKDAHGPYQQSEDLRVTVRVATPAGYTGTLNDAPTSSSTLHVGSSVSFEARHIVAVFWDPRIGP